MRQTWDRIEWCVCVILIEKFIGVLHRDITMHCHKRVCLEHGAAPTPSLSTGTTVHELADFMRTCPPAVYERILSYFNQLSYAEWFETANTAGWPDVLHELRSLREGDCTMYSEYGQVIDWNDVHEYPGPICGCVEGMRGFESTSYAAGQCDYNRYDGMTDAQSELVMGLA